MKFADANHMTGKDPSLVGRGEELSRLRDLVAPPYAESRTLLLGDPGVGKTVLLAAATREARSAGIRVLAAVGRESEQELAFAGLHQLLRRYSTAWPAYRPARPRRCAALSPSPTIPCRPTRC